MITTEQIINYLISLVIILPSLTFHEFAHAWTAYKFGDMTAKNMGRLTLNPIAHVSLLGTIIMPYLIHFGWAKPVPVNFSILNKRQIFLVAAAGPLSNLLLALVLTACYHIRPIRAIPAIGPVIPFVIYLNFILAFFNLIPIPPLDGSRMVYAWLKSQNAINLYNEFSQFGLIILLAFMWYGGFSKYVDPIINAILSLLRISS
jgi:Zn-dependent protease